MKPIKKFFFVVSVLFCFMNMQCEDDDINIDSNNLLIGNWIDPIYDGEQTSFRRATTLPDEDYGILFKENRDFVERSSGWCGTPPLIFSDYNGKWQLDNTLITLSKEQFPSNYAWRIVSLTENELVVKRELTEQEQDHRELMILFNEFQELASRFSCTNASDWAFTAYGSKACGGPQGYIAYSTHIDTAIFLQKVDAYTQAENEYNVKWGIVSTCDIQNPPKSIACQNGFPILKY
ncbi:lipocalin family protein [Changchengzhania lutea]|uniref:lipocalin family protein n=1 Tax=Changchengzhania lutea TaxID=2049305 RepID=UPI00115DA0C9|nr:lipocalin family protein [Changchengzhania lutea]